MKLVRIRRVVAALLLSFPFVTAGEGEARAGGGASEITAKTSRGAWAVLEMRRRGDEGLRRLPAAKKPGVTKSEPKLGLSAFSHDGQGRRMSVLRYQTPLSFGRSNFMLKMRAPGGGGSIMRVELEF
jgi:hypothetical protein